MLNSGRYRVMERKTFTHWGLILCILVAILIPIQDKCTGRNNTSCSASGKIKLRFADLPAGVLPVFFKLDRVTGIRVYGRIKRIGTSLWLLNSEEDPPGTGNKKEAAMMFLFCQLSCKVCTISVEVNGHGREARIVATQRDGSVQTATCSGRKQILTLNAILNNPFTWVVFSGQDTEWLGFQLE